MFMSQRTAVSVKWQKEGVSVLIKVPFIAAETSVIRLVSLVTSQVNLPFHVAMATVKVYYRDFSFFSVLYFLVVSRWYP